jgi:hypothetical protein
MYALPPPLLSVNIQLYWYNVHTNEVSAEVERYIYDE